MEELGAATGSRDSIDFIYYMLPIVMKQNIAAYQIIRE